jgi:hypothetical protein
MTSATATLDGLTAELRGDLAAADDAHAEAIGRADQAHGAAVDLAERERAADLATADVQLRVAFADASHALDDAVNASQQRYDEAVRTLLRAPDDAHIHAPSNVRMELRIGTQVKASATHQGGDCWVLDTPDGHVLVDAATDARRMLWQLAEPA